MRDRGLDGRLDVLALRHVAAHGVAADRRRRLLRGRLVEVRDDDRRALAASRFAVAAPMPFAPPVTSAVLPWNLVMRRRYTVRVVEFRDILAKRRMHRAFAARPAPARADRAHRRRHPPRAVRRLQPGRQHRRRHRRGEAARDRRGVRATSTTRTGRNFIADAPVHLVISANESLYHARYNEPDKLEQTGGVEITWPVPYWFVDAGALMMLVLAAAIDEGLASAFIGHPDQKRIFDELLGLPHEVVPIGLGLIGKPAPDPFAERGSSRMKERRRPLDDLVHWERW